MKKEGGGKLRMTVIGMIWIFACTAAFAASPFPLTVPYRVLKVNPFGDYQAEQSPQPADGFSRSRPGTVTAEFKDEVQVKFDGEKSLSVIDEEGLAYGVPIPAIHGMELKKGQLIYFPAYGFGNPALEVGSTPKWLGNAVRIKELFRTESGQTYVYTEQGETIPLGPDARWFTDKHQGFRAGEEVLDSITKTHIKIAGIFVSPIHPNQVTIMFEKDGKRSYRDPSSVRALGQASPSTGAADQSDGSASGFGG